LEPSSERGGGTTSLAVARRRGFLSRLSPEAAEEIIEAAPVVRYPAGAVVFRVGPSIVVSGLLGYSLSYPNGRQITIKYVGAGDLVGSLALSESALTTGVHAVEPSVLLHLDPARLQAVAARRPQVATALLEEMTGRLRIAYQALATRSFAPVRARVARDLIERARAGNQLHPRVRLQATQQALAQATGSVREVVARSLRDLRQKGVIKTEHSVVTILDVPALAEEAGLTWELLTAGN
jgi:CRP/FNR family transcriptional regulator